MGTRCCGSIRSGSRRRWRSEGERMRDRAIDFLLIAAVAAWSVTMAQDRPKRPPRTGVSTPGVKREMSAITPAAVFPIAGTPDWQVVTEDAVWVSNAPKGTVHRLDPK